MLFNPVFPRIKPFRVWAVDGDRTLNEEIERIEKSHPKDMPPDDNLPPAVPVSCGVNHLGAVAGFSQIGFIATLGAVVIALGLWLVPIALSWSEPEVIETPAIEQPQSLAEPASSTYVLP